AIAGLQVARALWTIHRAWRAAPEGRRVSVHAPRLENCFLWAVRRLPSCICSGFGRRKPDALVLLPDHERAWRDLLGFPYWRRRLLVRREDQACNGADGPVAVHCCNRAYWRGHPVLPKA